MESFLYLVSGTAYFPSLLVNLQTTHQNHYSKVFYVAFNALLEYIGAVTSEAECKPTLASGLRPATLTTTPWRHSLLQW